MAIYSALLLLVLLASSPWWLWQMAVSGRYRAGLLGRLGWIPDNVRQLSRRRDSRQKLLWLHAVSVGEVLAAETLIQAWTAEMPDWEIVVSTTTATGQQIARERLRIPAFYFPLDLAFAIRPYLRALRPTLFVTFESELWPRMLVECERANIAVAVVNARISDRSLPRYKRLRMLWRPLLNKVAVFCAQSQQSADRLVEIGVDAGRVSVTGNLKYDTPLPQSNTMVAHVRAMLNTVPLVVAGSTLQGEEEILLEQWPELLRRVPNAILLIAPRHPQRFDEVFALILARGLPCVRLSRLPASLQNPAPGTILLLDTLGDLAAIYGLASVALIGGSLVNKGGHNPLEATRFHIPVLMGSSYENFREMVEPMLAQGVVHIVGPNDIAQALADALARPRAQPDSRTTEPTATANTMRALKNLVQQANPGKA
jgi:3-deoxy-D-manno-octulosonic-acid transferase